LPLQGATSFDDIRTIPGQVEPCETFYEACLGRGLLADDGKWRLCLGEATQMQTGRRLRELFVTILLFGDAQRPQLLWQEYRKEICSDLRFRIIQARLMRERDITDDTVADYGLFLIEQLLQEARKSLSHWTLMPRLQLEWDRIAVNLLLDEHLAYDENEQRTIFEDLHAQLNADQLQAYTAIIDSIAESHGGLFFLKGSAGTGKTFVYKTICTKVRSEGQIIIAVSSSGISALLIPGGRTAQSAFQIPVGNINEFSSCRIDKRSHHADVLRQARAIIWDEVSAQHHYAIEAIDRTLHDIRGCDRPFGGLTTILGGDFLQTLPVVPGGSREETADASIQRSVLWDHVSILPLRQNMWLQNATDPLTRRFLLWLSDVGHGIRLSGDSGLVRSI
jgi:hypothetical protein